MRVRSDFAHAYNDLGNVLKEIGRIEETRRAYLKSSNSIPALSPFARIWPKCTHPRQETRTLPPCGLLRPTHGPLPTGVAAPGGCTRFVTKSLSPTLKVRRDGCRILRFTWDECCLRFYETKRHVRTASATQARQAIDRGAIDRWRGYEEFLGPLLAELDFLIRAASSS